MKTKRTFLDNFIKPLRMNPYHRISDDSQTSRLQERMREAHASMGADALCPIGGRGQPKLNKQEF